MNLIPDNIDFSAYMEEPEQHDIRPASDWLQDTIDAFYAPPDTTSAPTMLWKISARAKSRCGPA
jgi:twinkle protein